MEAATVPAKAVQKRLFRNNTPGWLGVVTLSPKGDTEGTSVEPHGTVWLSDDEVILTARAPRHPEDNPFELQTHVRVDPETDQRVEYQLRPLTAVPEEEARAMPLVDRYVPTSDAPQAPERAPEPVPATPPNANPSSAATVVTAPPVQTQPAPPSQEPQAPRPEESWVVEPEAPGRVLQGALRGDNTPPPPTEEQPPPTAPPVAGQGQVVPEAPGATVVAAEEHAAAVDPSIGEETGAARPPASPQPEGEYASAEEVGSPDAPASNEPTQNGG